jgi:hypothetical protein
VRLRDREGFLRSAAESGDVRPWLRLASAALKTAAVVAQLEQMPDEALSEMASADLSTLEKYLVFLREHYAYDLVFGWADVDRPVPAFVAFLESYWKKASSGSPPA